MSKNHNRNPKGKNIKGQELMEKQQASLPSLHNGNIETPNRTSLDDVRGIRNEMTRVYRLVFQGKIMLEEATRLVYILREMIQAIKAETELDTLAKAYSKAWGGVAIITDDEVIDA